jgi:DNA topoisomerase-1
MMLKLGRFGRFLACTNEECKATRDVESPATSSSDSESSFENEVCENCGKPMALKRGKWGQFLACTGYPDCKTTKKIGQVGTQKADKPLEELCPQCGKHLMLRQGRFGEFISCSNYPECKYIKHDTTGVACVRPGCDGDLVKRKSKRGRIFYGCSRYPECDHVYWDRPLPQNCPKCNYPFLLEKVNKQGTHTYCRNEGCGYKSDPVASQAGLSTKKAS